jgi:glutaredoxin-related protein
MNCTALTMMVLVGLMAGTGRVSAQDVLIGDPSIDATASGASATPIADFIATEAATLALDPQGQRPVAIEYSDAHELRAKIHKYASWATLPLMAAEFALGEKLYNDTNSETDSLRGVHGAVGAGLIGLFGVNSVTGLWNLLESNQAPGHTKRLLHGILMLAAEGGLVASAASAPGHSRNQLATIDTNKATHRDIAFVSIGVGTAGYLLMLFTKN